MGAEADTGVGTRVIDLHNHVIPGVDDGARHVEESRQALRAMAAGAVRALVATPHVDASIVLRHERFTSRMAELDAGWERLESLVQSEFVELDVRRGAEVKLDIPEPDLSDDRLRLGGGPFALVEFPYFTIPPRSAHGIAHLRAKGWYPVIAHPERYGGIESDMEILKQWRAAGAYTQLNGASLLGRYGSAAKSAAMQILANGWADYISSDYHARGPTEIATYRDLLIEMDGEQQCELLMWSNPQRMLEGQRPLAVPPLSGRRGIWDRIMAPFR